MARVATASLDQTVKVASPTWTHEFLTATGAQPGERETGLPLPWLPQFQTAHNPMPDQGHPEMDGLACLLEIPTRLCCSGQLPLRVWDCLFIIGTVLEMEPRTSLCYIKPGFYPSPAPPLSLCVAMACLELRAPLPLPPNPALVT